MREFRIKVPDLKDGQRVLAATRERMAAASSEALEKAQTFGGRVHDRVDDLEAPRINLLDARKIVRHTNDRLEAAETLLQSEHDETAAQMQRLGEAEMRGMTGPSGTSLGCSSGSRTSSYRISPSRMLLNSSARLTSTRARSTSPRSMPSRGSRQGVPPARRPV